MSAVWNPLLEAQALKARFPDLLAAYTAEHVCAIWETYSDEHWCAGWISGSIDKDEAIVRQVFTVPGDEKP